MVHRVNLLIICIKHSFKKKTGYYNEASYLYETLQRYRVMVTTIGHGVS